mmetsp:Transcript_15017/g.34546  ORF Transcript_15017/g.34546 Transcript_15017/m.34546 type:complete len:220 (+) Transcript_15017:63-722(+)
MSEEVLEFRHGLGDEPVMAGDLIVLEAEELRELVELAADMVVDSLLFEELVPHVLHESIDTEEGLALLRVDLLVLRLLAEGSLLAVGEVEVEEEGGVVSGVFLEVLVAMDEKGEEGDGDGEDVEGGGDHDGDPSELSGDLIQIYQPLPVGLLLDFVVSPSHDGDEKVEEDDVHDNVHRQESGEREVIGHLLGVEVPPCLEESSVEPPVLVAGGIQVISH